MESGKFSAGDPVWAKMRGYPFWPAKICNPTVEQLGLRPKNKKCHFVFFFGSENFAWLPAENILTHNQASLRGYSRLKCLQKPTKEYAKYCRSISRKIVSQKEASINTKPSQTVSLSVAKGREMAENSPSYKKIGFIGLGLMGTAIVTSLLESGHDITVWNKTTEMCDGLARRGAKIAHSPAELIIACDITFCCVSDPAASKSLFYAKEGVLKGLEQAEKMGKISTGYVEMTTIDGETSKIISNAVTSQNGRYLEAPICGSSAEAEARRLSIVAAGDRSLFLDCETCFYAVAKRAYYRSCDVGTASDMCNILKSFNGTILAAVAETLALADRLNLDCSQYIQILNMGLFRSDSTLLSIFTPIDSMVKKNFKMITPLKHVQNCLDLCLNSGNKVSQSMPVTAAANEVYKHARLLKYSDKDASAVYQVTRY